MRHLKKDVQEIVKNGDCGLVFEDFDDVREGDEVVCYRPKEVVVPIDWDLKF